MDMYFEDWSCCSSECSEEGIRCKFCEYDALSMYGEKGEPLCRFHSAALGYCEECEDLFTESCSCSKTKENLERYLENLEKYFRRAYSKRNASEDAEQKEEFKQWNSICMDIQESAVMAVMANPFGLVLEEWIRIPL